MRYAILSTILISLITGGLSLHAQDAPLPRYVRYCDQADSALLIQTMSAVDLRLNSINDLLSRLESGSLSVAEGAPLVDDFLAQWEGNPDQIHDCQEALKAGVQEVLYELLITMLYEATTDQVNAGKHLLSTKEGLVRIRAQIKDATNYLNTGTVQPASTTVPGAIPVRSGAELAQTIHQFLVDKGVTLLRGVNVSSQPGAITLLIELYDVPNFEDYINALFIMDRISTLIAGWEELSLIAHIIIEIYDQDGNRILFVESSGANFTAYYYTGTITREEFEARLTRIGS